MKSKGFAIMLAFAGAVIVLIGCYYTMKGSLLASVIATVGACIMAWGFSKFDSLTEKDN